MVDEFASWNKRSAISSAVPGWSTVLANVVVVWLMKSNWRNETICAPL